MSHATSHAHPPKAVPYQWENKTPLCGSWALTTLTPVYQSINQSIIDDLTDDNYQAWLPGLNTSHRHTSETHVNVWPGSQGAERVSCIGHVSFSISVTGQGASRGRWMERPPSSPSTSEFSSCLLCKDGCRMLYYRKQRVKEACGLCTD